MVMMLAISQTKHWHASVCAKFWIIYDYTWTGDTGMGRRHVLSPAAQAYRGCLAAGDMEWGFSPECRAGHGAALRLRWMMLVSGVVSRSVSLSVPQEAGSAAACWLLCRMRRLRRVASGLTACSPVQAA